MKAILLGDAMIPGEGFGKAWEKHLSKYGNNVVVDNWESDWGQLQYRRLEVEKRGPEIETVDETILKEGKDAESIYYHFDTSAGCSRCWCNIDHI